MPQKTLRVNFISFGFKHGVPIDCDMVVDTRFLPNPFFVDNLRDKSGHDEEVKQYVLKSGRAETFVGKYGSLLDYLLPLYIDGGKSYINIGVGCTGGKHRSVVVSEMLAKCVEAQPLAAKCLISVQHRDIEKPN